MLHINFFRLVRLSLGVLAVALLLRSVAVAQTNEDSGRGNAALAGAWKMASETPSGDMIDWTLTLTQKDGIWSATVRGPEDQPPKPAGDLRVTGNKVHFQTMYQSDPYEIDLTLQNGVLSGTWSGNGGSGKTTGKRAK